MCRPGFAPPPALLRAEAGIVAASADTPPRDRATRKAHAIAQLSARAADAWVSTASTDGVAHLVPLSLAWVAERAVLAVEATSVTARNLASSGRARLGVGPTRDVVMLDTVLERRVDVGADAALAEAYAAQSDWDPRESPDYVFFVLRPTRLQAWREANEIAGRTLMRDGQWLI